MQGTNKTPVLISATINKKLELLTCAHKEIKGLCASLIYSERNDYLVPC